MEKPVRPSSNKNKLKQKHRKNMREYRMWLKENKKNNAQNK